ncbi:hypothetical protein FIBSPDRAFT_937307 [Athelia psychrophila]|uniref:BTB domain-containing protein n=1 Tax=Athelia psychrophila TaxID=1759441 RepID=A0A166AR06_9AGAM|nr:hypothetical protein FIBSPDRAFT_937307 [Fibularhizoctonia sp. CBS 109695]
MTSIRDSSAPSSPAVMPLTNSCASSPVDLAITEPTVDQIQELDAKGTQHPKYYFEDGNIVFQVEDTLYNVHRYFFARDSAHFRAIFQGTVQGTNATKPCVLSNLNCADFDEFLAILYPTDFRRPAKKTTAQWISVLHLAAEWAFTNIKLLAIDNLTENATPIDKIVLGRRYDITDWLPGAYEAVCTRADPLNLEEGRRLGVEDTVRISAARQVYGTCKARYETECLAGDLGDIFSLGKSSEGNVSSMNSEEKVIYILEGQVMEARVEYLATSTSTGQGRSNTQCGNYSSVGELTPNQKKMRSIRLQKEKEEAERPAKEREQADQARKEREQADRARKEREQAERVIKENEEVARVKNQREQAERVMKEREKAMKEREQAIKEREQAIKEREHAMNEKEEADRVMKQRQEAEQVKKIQAKMERTRAKKERAETGLEMRWNRPSE